MSEETFGAGLRWWRGQKGLSIRGLAARGHYGKSQISDLENGVRFPRPDVAARLDEILGADGELVALADRERASRTTRVSGGATFDPRHYADLATRLLAAGQEGWNMMDRRSFVVGVGGFASFAGLGLTAPTLALEAARHGLTLSLAEQRADVAVDEWHAIVVENGYSYQTTAPIELLQSLIVDVLAIQYAIGHQKDDTTLREFRRAGASLAALMAMTVGNLGHVVPAVRWWRSARRFAHQSGDVNTIVWVRGLEVVRALHEQRPLAMVLRLVDEAELHAEQSSVAARSELLAGKAQALALTGRVDAASSALHELEDVYATLPSGATADREMVFGWAEDRLRFTESFVYSNLGDLERADIAQRRAIEVYPADYRRGPAQIELHRALCLVRGNDVTEGVNHAQSVLTGLSAPDHIRPIFDQGTRVLRAVPAKHQDHKGVADLRACLTSLEPRPLTA